MVIASGQSIEREALVSPVDLMARACQSALSDVPGLRAQVERISVVNILTRSGPAPASELAARVGVGDAHCEVTTIGGNSPQWLVNRAAADIAAGSLSVTVIAGAEAIRSYRGRHQAGLPRDDGDIARSPDSVIGDDLPGVGPAESAIGLVLPIHVYPLFENALAARCGRDSAAQRLAIGQLLAPFTLVAASNPYAWFREQRSAADIATPSPTNRLVSDPYTKRMTAFLGSDQGAALVLCSLAAARRAGVAERAVFVWSGAEANDIRFPSARPDLGTSPAIAAAGAALFAAASVAAGNGAAGIGIDDVEVLDLYSCFPSAVQMACDALGVRTDDARGLTATGGLPYFGGPGNNYTTHGIAAVTDALREHSGVPGGTQFGLATGLGWFVTKHALGLYATTPPPAGFRPGDTGTEQERIDADALEVAFEVPEPTEARVVSATVTRGSSGEPDGAPLIARLPDGRQVVAAAADATVLADMGGVDPPSLIGTNVVVTGTPPRYRLPDR